jgi:hypothetical protein
MNFNYAAALLPLIASGIGSQVVVGVYLRGGGLCIVLSILFFFQCYRRNVYYY